MTRRRLKKDQVKEFIEKPEFKFHFDGYESIRPELLETFGHEYAGRRTRITIETDEFTAVCPWSGLPDFAKISVEYVPGAQIIELRSFKYYLYSYRTVGIFQEHLTQRLLLDLVACCDPMEMTVRTDYNIRGGIHTTAQASYERPGRNPRRKKRLRT